MKTKTKPADLAHTDIAKRVLTQEAEALHLLADSLDASFERAVEACAAATGRVICAGIGKSGHVARKIAATLASTGTPAQFVHPTEASHGDFGMITKDDVIVALSRSGETAELSDLIQYARRFSIPLISMTAVADSSLGKAGDILMLVPNVKEACNVTSAPTTSTTLMMAFGDALAVALLEKKGFRADDFKVLHPGGKLGAMLVKVEDVMRTGDAIPLVQTGTSLDLAFAEMSAKSLGCVGVTDAEGGLIGVLTDGDVRRMYSLETKPATIDEVMKRGPYSTSPAELAYSALGFMNEKSITQLFVVDNGNLLGILHMHDLLRAGIA